MPIVMYDGLVRRLLAGFLASDTGCWVWSKAVDDDGYGTIWSQPAKRNLRAHRVAYEAMVGPIPESLTLDHLCRNRACVRPDHLEPVTAVENVMRGTAFVAVNARKTRCVNGHDLRDAYTYDTYKTEPRRNGRVRRVCRTCVNERAKNR